MFNILLAEDNPADVFLIRMALEQHQIIHHLHVVTDGGAALDFVARMGKPGGVFCPDLVLLDMNLPKADGPSVLSALREHPLGGHTPVIVATSSAIAAEQARMAALGARYFRKPVELDGFMRLGEVVREVLGPEPAEGQKAVRELALAAQAG